MEDEATWLECIDEDGNIYYYNELTNESTWLLPNHETAHYSPIHLSEQPYQETIKSNTTPEIKVNSEESKLLDIVQISEAPVDIFDVLDQTIESKLPDAAQTAEAPGDIVDDLDQAIESKLLDTVQITVAPVDIVDVLDQTIKCSSSNPQIRNQEQTLRDQVEELLRHQEELKQENRYLLGLQSDTRSFVIQNHLSKTIIAREKAESAYQFQREHQKHRSHLELLQRHYTRGISNVEYKSSATQDAIELEDIAAQTDFENDGKSCPNPGCHALRAYLSNKLEITLQKAVLHAEELQTDLDMQNQNHTLSLQGANEQIDTYLQKVEELQQAQEYLLVLNKEINQEVSTLKSKFGLAEAKTQMLALSLTETQNGKNKLEAEIENYKMKITDIQKEAFEAQSQAEQMEAAATESLIEIRASHSTISKLESIIDQLKKPQMAILSKEEPLIDSDRSEEFNRTEQVPINFSLSDSDSSVNDHELEMVTRNKINSICRIDPAACHIMNSAVMVSSDTSIELTNTDGLSKSWKVNRVLGPDTRNNELFRTLADSSEREYICVFFLGDSKSMSQAALIGNDDDPGILARFINWMVKSDGEQVNVEKLYATRQDSNMVYQQQYNMSNLLQLQVNIENAENLSKGNKVKMKRKPKKVHTAPLKNATGLFDSQNNCLQIYTLKCRGLPVVQLMQLPSTERLVRSKCTANSIKRHRENCEVVSTIREGIRNWCQGFRVGSEACSILECMPFLDSEKANVNLVAHIAPHLQHANESCCRLNELETFC